MSTHCAPLKHRSRWEDKKSEEVDLGLWALSAVLAPPPPVFIRFCLIMSMLPTLAATNRLCCLRSRLGRRFISTSVVVR